MEKTELVTVLRDNPDGDGTDGDNPTGPVPPKTFLNNVFLVMGGIVGVSLLSYLGYYLYNNM